MDWHDLLAYFWTCDRAAYLKTVAFIWDVEICKIAEIGVFSGRLSLRLRQEFPESRLYLIDPWRLPKLSEEAAPISADPNAYEEAFFHVKSQFEKDPLVSIIRKPSAEACAEIPGDLDLVFIDADHSYDAVKTDLASWAPKVRKGGIIAGHDYHADAFPGVVKAVDEYFEKVVVGHDCIWMVKK